MFENYEYCASTKKIYFPQDIQIFSHSVMIFMNCRPEYDDDEGMLRARAKRPNCKNCKCKNKACKDKCGKCKKDEETEETPAHLPLTGL